MRLSSMGDYAVVTMTAAAQRCGRLRVSAQQLADETGLPTPTVQKLVSKLSAAGLLRAVRGAGGGLTLARPAATISLADIIEAVEGPIAMVACSDRHPAGRQECSLESACSVRPHWPLVDAALRGALAGISLSQLAGHDRPAPAPARPLFVDAPTIGIEA
ncbi:RrF2 family transcriptional regulator [Novosphingobium sp.]|uniref:RrF2 family transcriptional regulator n=1 Tax=Novosphingobium sp. TaxID=1874826 RepID=UPI003B516CA5